MGVLQLWGGCECTVNRIGDRFHDQTHRSGHHDRPEDLDLIAALGIKSLRYPILWERIAPERADAYDWRWTDERIGRLQSLGVRPIASLVHHGSGPRYTSLLDPAFAEGLAMFARRAVERYPQIVDWTPVNEPLTTARFSALYGLWYPHVQEEGAFWTALLNQIDGVRLAMGQIRTVNPAARLVQTEDLGRTYATRAAAHQATFDNDRRWMTWDLLCGRVVPGHPLWSRLVGLGFEDRLRRIADSPCPPEVVGVNHYLTSDRFLDHRRNDYPPETWGGNEFIEFADVEAVRVLTPEPGGLEGALEEAWDRYGRTLAVTECHVGCTREEQVRWLNEAWETVHNLRGRGVDVEALTAWALLGSYDWNSLLVRQDGRYESGAFDVSSGVPRPTAVATALRALSGLSNPPPCVDGVGWWRRDLRLMHRPVFRSVEHPEPRRARHTRASVAAPLLITGATGTLGRALARACEWRGLDFVLTDRRQLTLEDEAGLARALDVISPWAVINAAGWVRVDEAEGDVEECFAANALGAVRLARACDARQIPFAGFSSDLVFDGAADAPYDETATPNPLNTYGRSKAEAEAEILRLDGALMIRTAAFFSPYDPHNFAAQVLHALAGGREVVAAGDLVVSPAYVPDLVDATLNLVIDEARGLWHLANESAVSWAEFARAIAARFGFDPGAVREVPWRSFGWAAERPTYAPLTSARGRMMPSLDDALNRYVAVMHASHFEGVSELERSRHAAIDTGQGVINII